MIYIAFIYQAHVQLFGHFISVLNTWLQISEFQKLWRSVPVDSMDEEKIEEYLKKQGISSMQETGPKKVVSVHSAWVDLIALTFQMQINMASFISPQEVKAAVFNDIFYSVNAASP